MDKIPLDAKPLSWWLTNAVKRVEEDAVDRSKKGLLYVYHAWKSMALIQEQKIDELKDALRTAKCPDDSCKDGIIIMVESGIASGMMSDENGEPVAVQYLEEIPHQVQCEWCAERDRLIYKFEIHDDV